jgi:hypothetical protein
MKTLMLLALLFCAAPALAECEASHLEGQHTALQKQTALDGAWEEAADICYPGKSEKLDSQCTSIADSTGRKQFQCTQTVTCTLCGDDLRRKVEAKE